MSKTRFFFGADFGAALGNVAVAEAEFVFQQGRARNTVERMPFEACGADEETRATEIFVFCVIAEDVADVLAEKTLDTFAEFLDAVHVALIHFPFDAFARLEGRNFAIDLVVPGNVCDEVFDNRERFEWGDCDWLFERKRIEARFAG